jgi:hypothetical protein
MKTAVIIALALFALPSAAIAGHSELTVPPAQSFALGGDQPKPMMVRGTNLGPSEVAILSRTGTVESLIATVPVGGKFEHSFAQGETALLQNKSTTATARLSVDFDGTPASLSMNYERKPKP